MTITLNDKESRDYLEMKDKEIMYVDIQGFIAFLGDIKYRMTPIEQRYPGDASYHREVISWENALPIIAREHKYLQEKLKSIVNKYRKEER